MKNKNFDTLLNFLKNPERQDTKTCVAATKEISKLTNELELTHEPDFKLSQEDLVPLTWALNFEPSIGLGQKVSELKEAVADMLIFAGIKCGQPLHKITLKALKTECCQLVMENEKMNPSKAAHYMHAFDNLQIMENHHEPHDPVVVGVTVDTL